MTKKEKTRRLRHLWRAMKERCYSAETTVYARYGGRGIRMCDEWRNDFESFRTWAIEAGYRRNLQIDRQDNDGHYCPDNCRWANRSVQGQNRNKRPGGTSAFIGVCRVKDKWRAEIRRGKSRRNLGSFESETTAAHAYDRAAFELYGASAKLNFGQHTAFVHSIGGGSSVG